MMKPWISALPAVAVLAACATDAPPPPVPAPPPPVSAPAPDAAEADPVPQAHPTKPVGTSELPPAQR